MQLMTVASIIFCLGVVTNAHAVPGDLDTTFSGDGKIVETALASSVVNSLAIQADGKIVVAGSLGGDFLVARYNANGTLDTSFSGDGIVVTDFGGSGTDSALAVAIQGDGKIVVAGNAGLANNARVGVARYNANGTLDNTFSGDGLFTMDFVDAAGGAARGLAIQADGRIVIVGSSGSDFAIARLNGNGTLDTTFGPQPSTGIITKDFGSGNESATAVAVLPDGRIVVAGSTAVAGRAVFAWDYFSSTGIQQVVGPSTDSTGAPINGARHTSFGGGVDASPTGIAIQSDGKVVLVGDATFASGIPGDIDRFMAVARYNVDGTMDTTFNGAGLRGVDFGDGTSSFASGVAIQADGKIVVVGHVAENFNNKFAVARFNTNGSMDSTFSGDGLLTTDFSATTNDSADAVAIQRSDGRIVVAGSAGSRMALARYHAFTCNGLNVTILGTDGPNVITGTLKPDVVHGLGGNDFIDGSGGDDTICGGDGNDALIGGTGNDTLVAGLGSDSLSGNDGTDVCIGSQLLLTDPLDTFNSCETINTGRAGVSGEWLAVEELCNRSEQNPKCRLRGTLRVFNPGVETTAVPSAVAFFVSEDPNWDENDSFLAIEQVPALEAGGEAIVRVNLKLPEGVSAAGAFIIAVVDFYDDVAERNETNNIAVSTAVSSLLDRVGRQE
jgi:uncharacterized delta-60 repeat protein